MFAPSAEPAVELLVTSGAGLLTAFLPSALALSTADFFSRASVAAFSSLAALLNLLESNSFLLSSLSTFLSLALTVFIRPFTPVADALLIAVLAAVSKVVASSVASANGPPSIIEPSSTAGAVSMDSIVVAQPAILL